MLRELSSISAFLLTYFYGLCHKELFLAVPASPYPIYTPFLCTHTRWP